jgi:hypothetical protein
VQRASRGIMKRARSVEGAVRNGVRDARNRMVQIFARCGTADLQAARD